LNEIAPINKVIPLGLAVQAPLKGKMIHNPNNLFWRFSWVVPYSFFFGIWSYSCQICVMPGIKKTSGKQ